MSEILGNKIEATSIKERRRTEGMEGQRRRESRYREHSYICISFLKHLMIQDSLVVMNIIMF